MDPARLDTYSFRSNGSTFSENFTRVRASISIGSIARWNKRQKKNSPADIAPIYHTRCRIHITKLVFATDLFQRISEISPQPFSLSLSFSFSIFFSSRCNSISFVSLLNSFIFFFFCFCSQFETRTYEFIKNSSAVILRFYVSFVK